MDRMEHMGEAIQPVEGILHSGEVEWGWLMHDKRMEQVYTKNRKAFYFFPYSDAVFAVMPVFRTNNFLCG